jgi:N-formylglutamate amidohydrolase
MPARRISRRAVLLTAPLVALGVLTRGVAAQSELLEAVRGDLPLLLTVPHDGTDIVPGVPRRSGGVQQRDVGTLPLARGVAEALAAALGARPYLVAARFHRRYIDANRSPDEAYEVAAAAPYYEAYHGQVAAYVAELRTRFAGGALLLDVHGQAFRREALMRGTLDGLTVTALLARAGQAALTGPLSVFGQLQARGYSVIPPNTPPGAPPETRFRGGYTVQAYGSQHPTGIDAIQIEVGAVWRQPATAPRLAVDLAEALAVFTTAYLRDHQLSRAPERAAGLVA